MGASKTLMTSKKLQKMTDRALKVAYNKEADQWTRTLFVKEFGMREMIAKHSKHRGVRVKPEKVLCTTCVGRGFVMDSRADRHVCGTCRGECVVPNTNVDNIRYRK